MEQSWINALMGGGLIGIASTIMLLGNGRVTGISGIFFGLIKPQIGDVLWRVLFIGGLMVGGVIGGIVFYEPFTATTNTPYWLIAVAGLLVGFGTRMGGGCTSGHGVCGISRLSVRSIVATMTFILAGVFTVFVTSALLGG